MSVVVISDIVLMKLVVSGEKEEVLKVTSASFSDESDKILCLIMP